MKFSLLMMLLALAAAGGAAAGFAWRDRHTRMELASLEHTRAVRDRLSRDRDELAVSNADLAERTRRLEVELELERGGRLEAASTVKSLQNELSGVREQLSFYQTIVPGDDSVDMTVQEFRVNRGAGEFRFRAVLTRTSGRRVSSSGTFRLAVSGEREGKRVRLGHKELVAGRVDGLKFQIQHFKRLEGTFSLPADFQPARIVLEIRMHGDEAGRMQRIYAWDRAVG